MASPRCSSPTRPTPTARSSTRRRACRRFRCAGAPPASPLLRPGRPTKPRWRPAWRTWAGQRWRCPSTTTQEWPASCPISSTLCSCVGDLMTTVVGAGLLATAISEALNTDRREVRADDLADLNGLFGNAGGARLLITASDAWDGRADDRIQALCVAAGVSWLPVRTELGRTVIGPGYRPGAAGCSTCAELRRSLADEHFSVRQAVRQRYERLAEDPSPWLTTLTARTVAALT